jgi:hypothetical protein
LRVIERQKDLELFEFWRRGLVAEWRGLLDLLPELKSEPLTFWCTLERINFIEGQLRPPVVEVSYFFFKQMLKVRRCIDLFIVPGTNRIRSSRYVSSDYYSLYSQEEANKFKSRGGVK